MFGENWERQGLSLENCQWNFRGWGKAPRAPAFRSSRAHVYTWQRCTPFDLDTFTPIKVTKSSKEGEWLKLHPEVDSGHKILRQNVASKSRCNGKNFFLQIGNPDCFSHPPKFLGFQFQLYWRFPMQFEKREILLQIIFATQFSAAMFVMKF